MKALATKEEIKKLATKTELNAEQDKIIKIQTFDLSCFRGKSHFECDDIQNYIVFQPAHRYFSKIGNNDGISAWKSKGLLSDEIIKPPITSNISISPALNYIGAKIKEKFNGSCLRQEKVTFTHKQVVNIYIFYETNFWPFKQSLDFTLRNSLFGALT